MFADNEINVIEEMKFIFGKAENIVGYQHFLLFQQYFLEASCREVLKVGIGW